MENTERKLHIQVPEQIMKPFSYCTEEGRKVFCLNLSDWMITEEKINELGTEPGYYPSDIETQLSEDFEAKFGDVKKFLNDIDKKGPVELTIERQQAIFRFFDNMHHRGSLFKELFNRSSNLPAKSTAEIVKMHLDGNVPNLFYDFLHCQGYSISMLANHTKVGLISLMNCFYPGPGGRFYMPISPYKAIVLANQNDSQFFRDRKPLIAPVYDEEQVRRLNDFALYHERRCGNQFVFAKTIDELQRLQSKRDDIVPSII